MYSKILVALDHSKADAALLPHVTQLAGIHGAELLLLHVADGHAARNYNQLKLAESEEMKEDRAYLEARALELRNAGLRVRTHLALGNPPNEILKAADQYQASLIAMTTHGHRWLADLFLGSTIDRVRHRTSIPILVVRSGIAP